MGDQFKPDEELTNEELEQHAGGKQALHRPYVTEPQPTTKALGEESQDGGRKIRRSL